MTTLYIDGTSAPAEIKAALHHLSQSIDFSKEDLKACNGYVFFGKNKVTEKSVAVKFYYWGGKPEFHAEPKQLAEITAENVLSIHDAGLINNNFAYFVTATCSKGDLDDVLNSTAIGNRAALKFTCEILSGLCHLHEKRFLHRDIKPSNIYVNENSIAVIGDFGSVKRLPDGRSSIPASSHSLLYRPPETVMHNSYGVSGDIYQTGVVLYQLLGGHLPYEGRAWLNKHELSKFASMANETDQNAFVDQCVKAKITNGKILNFSSLPPWVPDNLKRIIKRACLVDSSKRYPTASAFMAKLHECRHKTLDWRIEEGQPILIGNPSYRIISLGQLRVQKKHGVEWRNDNSFTGQGLKELVTQISLKALA